MDFDPRKRPRQLILVLGDQLNSDSAAFDGFDAQRDAVWMAEVTEESTHVWSHQVRTTIFLSAMRHFRDALRQRGITVHYRELEDVDNAGTLAGELAAIIGRLLPKRLIVAEPGEWRVAQDLARTAQEGKVVLETRVDRHFLCTREEFAAHAANRKLLRMEFFYRDLRQRFGVLMKDAKPAGEAWNYDTQNRESFGKKGPGVLPRPIAFPPDSTTRDVMQSVRRFFPDHPGNLETFDWAVTPEDARQVLVDFVTLRLPHFGANQDAMWTGESFLYHSRLSSALNLKLLNPRVVIAAAEKAFADGHAPLAAVEGFIRQILGWREYVRGVYWQFMPEFLELNALKATESLPAFYWNGDTDMNCLRQVIGQTLELGYAHHIQRLMVTGLFALLLGVKPQEVHKWYLAVYVDAVEWVELPNTLGMSQFGDGGIMGSKPYIATGKYIQRMSNYCQGCRYQPAERIGAEACPFTTLYWDFLMRHKELLSRNQRMYVQLKNLANIPEPECQAIREQANSIRKKCSCAGQYSHGSPVSSSSGQLELI